MTEKPDVQQQIDTLRNDIEILKTQGLGEAHKTALEHAWNHFSYHANQRLVTFRFYLIAVAVFIGTYIKTMIDEFVMASSVVAGLGAFFSYVFLRLDLRNHDLIKLSEAVIEKEENNLYNMLAYSEIKIMEKSNDAESRRSLPPNSYRQSLKLIFVLMIVFFIFGMGLPFFYDVSLFLRANSESVGLL